MRTLDNSKSILTLNKVIIDKLIFERFSDDVNKIMFDSGITFKHKINKVAENTFKVSFGIKITEDMKYNIDAQISGYFSVQDQSDLGEKLLKNNTVAILFPYLRSQLTLLSSQPGFEPIILPVMNITELMRED